MRHKIKLIAFFIVVSFKAGYYTDSRRENFQILSDLAEESLKYEINQSKICPIWIFVLIVMAGGMIPLLMIKYTAIELMLKYRFRNA